MTQKSKKMKLDKKIKKALDKDPLLKEMFIVEMIHQQPSYALIHLQKAIEMELKDREYLQKRNWIERMFSRMG